ncbi:MAG: toprim domain-containing protein, partial [Rhodoferax sp.]|nr:toprim domain-containing protein [Rhodoferax sp.]
ALREKGFALVTEGYMDVVALAQLGFPNAVATLGTACTPEHVQKLFRFTDSVIFSFDGDAAGKRAARKALEASLSWASDERSIKFLFLPEEHDPDSYIREHGEAAFASKIAQALPLSRFMLEVAKENSDLSTAEGRAQAASRGRPLWLKMPEGILKRQLLGEFAELSQLTSREILDLWGPSAGSGNRDLSGAGVSRKNGGTIARLQGGSLSAPTKSPGRPSQAARTNKTPTGLDQVLVAVLNDNAAFGCMSAEEQSVLTALPSPHGTLYAWLDSQWQEHGQQPWAALREGLRGHPLENWAVELWATHESGSSDLPATDHDQLQTLVRRLLIQRLKSQETEAIADAEHHPEALERYKELYARRRQLEQSPLPEAAAKMG